MEYIYVIKHLIYDGGTVCTSAVYAHYDKQEAVEEARKMNELIAKESLSVSKKHGRNCVDHFFVESVPIS